MKKSAILSLAGFVLLVVCLICLLVLDTPLANGQPFTFPAPDGASLAATYHPGTQPHGILLLEGFGSDQVTLHPLAREFAAAGWHVFTFDFSGHGRSGGSLTFNNAATDRLARQTITARQVFEQRSGLDASQIIYAGHSLGARVALQAATLDTAPVAGLVLLGPQVNLTTNTQAEFFTGTQDGDLPWVQALSADNPPVPLVIITGEWDDIITPAAARLLMARLTSGSASPAPDRTSVLLPRLLHNYEPYSSRVLAAAFEWLNLSPSQPPVISSRVWLWLAGLLGAALWLGGLQSWLPASAGDTALAMRNVRRFLLGKLALWLAALPFIALAAGIAFAIPIGAPVLNLFYVGFIGGYGILLALLYSLGRMPGISGKLRWRLSLRLPGRKPVLLALIFNAILFLAAALYARSGFYYVPLTGDRLLWALIFTPFTALGFWIGQMEANLLPDPRHRRLALLIGLLPFFLFAAFLAALGSLSGVTGNVQGLIILAIVLAQGEITRRLLGGTRWVGAILQSLLLYSLILPQGVLFLG